MAKTSGELTDILVALDRLQSRVRALGGEPEASGSSQAGTATAATEAEPEPTEIAAQDGPRPEAPAAAASDDDSRRAEESAVADPTSLAAIRAGIVELGRLQKVKEFPPFFARLAARSGLRMLLLKRWTSGMQVLLEEGVTLPTEVKQRRSDGRAPIPVNKEDIFTAVGQEVVVYAGPVPVKHFPLDLTLLLGRGSRERRIVLLPLPAREHWNSFIYLDAERGDGATLTIAETLAQYALSRLKLISSGERTRQGRVAGILKEEMCRRQRSRADAITGGGTARSRKRGGASPDPFADGADDGDATRGAGPAAGVAADTTATAAPDATATRATGATMESTSGDAGQPPSPPHSSDEHPGGDGSRRAAAVQEQAEEIVRQWEEAVLNRAAPIDEEGEDGAEAVSSEDAAADACRLDGVAGNPGAADILHASGELPALPKAACHIMAVIEDPRTTATKLEKAIALDQALTAKVLRVANSPFYGAVREIQTVSEAIVRLGFVTIRNWALVTATKSVFLAPGAGILYQKIWRQSVLSAMATQLVAQHLRLRESESLFVGGLMQNIGQLVLARSQPELFHRILEISATRGRPYHVVEGQVLGFDHGELGALLIKEWNLSEDLEEAVRWHHRFDHEEAKNARVAAMIALGEEIAACSGAEIVADDLQPENSATARFLEIGAADYHRLTELARGLSIDPAFFA